MNQIVLREVILWNKQMFFFLSDIGITKLNKN